MPRLGRSIETKKKTDALLDFIRQYQADNGGRSPSRRDMCPLLETDTVSVVNYYIGLLLKDGSIELDKYQPRSIMIVGMRTFRLWVCPYEGCDELSNFIGATCSRHNLEMKLVTVREV